MTDPLPRRLLLETAGPDFQPGIDVLASARCILGAEHRRDDWRPLVPPPPPRWAEPGEQARLLAAAEGLLTVFAHRLNRDHGTDHPRTAWRLLIMPWLVDVLAQSWLRWMVLAEIVARHGDEPVEAEVFTGPATWGFRNRADHWQRGMLHPLYGFWQDSLLLAAMAPPGWTLRPVARAIGTVALPDDGPIKHRRAAEPLPHQGIPAVPRLPGLGRVERVLVSGVLALRRVLDRPPPTARMPSAAPSLAAAAVAAGLPGPYAGVLETLLEATRPRTLGEDFATLSADIEAGRAGGARLLLVNGGRLYGDERNKARLAGAVAAGASVVPVQHGAGYGATVPLIDAAAVEYAQAGFLGWGWRSHEAGCPVAEPVPAPVPAGLRKGPLPSLAAWARPRRGNELILVGAALWPAFGAFMGVPVERDLLDYRETKVAFVSGLASAPRDALVYRPYPHGRDALEDAGFLEGRCGPIARCDGDLHARIRAGRLLVVDHPGTTFLLALAAGIPTIAYWAPDVWRWSAEAATQRRGLVRAGIVFDDAASAATAVNRVWDEVPEWWRSAPVRHARLAFLAHQVWRPRLPALAWMRAAWRVGRPNAAAGRASAGGADSG